MRSTNSLLLLFFAIIGCIIIASHIIYAIKETTYEERGIKLPEGFLIGVGSSAYQIEGATNEDGRGESVIDRFYKDNPNKSDGSVACDSYNKIKEDVALLKDLGVDFYRFSISWVRIVPTGDPIKINRVGIDHYHEVIDALLDAGIQPAVTIYHWDLPQPLQDLGGWTNKIIVDFFVDYARILFKEYGSKVKRWFTINEPQLISMFGYGEGQQIDEFFPPGLKGWWGFADYLSQHHMLIAHGRIYEMYQKEFKETQQGLLGPVLQMFWTEPFSDSEEDKKAAKRARLFEIDSMMYPLVKGDYPVEFKRIINNNSKAEGHRLSRLPVFKKSEVQLIKGSYDFIGLNYYTSYSVRFSENFTSPSQSRDFTAERLVVPNSFTPGVPWLSHIPNHLRLSLNYLKNTYGNIKLFITENGCDDPNGLNDTDKINYFKGYLKELMLAIYEDGCEVEGYSLWSFLDSFEWSAGYKSKFGIYHVDFNDPKRPRTPKKSAYFIKELIKTRILPV